MRISSKSNTLLSSQLKLRRSKNNTLLSPQLKLRRSKNNTLLSPQLKLRRSKNNTLLSPQLKLRRSKNNTLLSLQLKLRRLILALLLIPIIISANGGVINDFPTLLRGITKFLSEITLALLSIPIVAGAYQLITAEGDPGKIEHGKKMIIYAFVGAGTLLFANATVDLILEIIQKMS